MRPPTVPHLGTYYSGTLLTYEDRCRVCTRYHPEPPRSYGTQPAASPEYTPISIYHRQPLFLSSCSSPLTVLLYILAPRPRTNRSHNRACVRISRMHSACICTVSKHFNPFTVLASFFFPLPFSPSLVVDILFFAFFRVREVSWAPFTRVPWASR
ncbi:hypothetical protein P280DRAFT_120607 [Massarina eburnea CBS 473.64]|uniref:Uncharacterized protein n=1 Tax=Massarina eburnea CBS 473.64 TaxID=1395130 RepID=A0A6A6SCA1_9PLEO|nr:hypothetical protein P280DRAFT_120607 [Massarina eburnea CBS 473.64]